MLTGKIMHGCIKKLVNSKDEESLESLSKLLTTVGKDLEQETDAKLNSMSISDAKAQVETHTVCYKLVTRFRVLYFIVNKVANVKLKYVLLLFRVSHRSTTTSRTSSGWQRTRS